MNILVLCDDFWHPAEVLELGFQQIKTEHTFTFVKDAKDILTPEYIEKFPLIICCKSNVINASNTNSWFDDEATEVTPAEFKTYIENGGGFLSLHAGNTAKVGEAYADLVGNYFLSHPPRCSIQVEMSDKNHPITAGVPDFEIRDEHYNIALTCDDANVFCKTISETGGEQIGGYTKELGSGRICVLTPGHILSVFENEHFQKLLLQAIDWCAKN
jgi:Uncharacterized protein conserved in bacteria